MRGGRPDGGGGGRHPPVQRLTPAEPHPGLAASGRGAVQPWKPPPLPHLLHGGALAAPAGFLAGFEIGVQYQRCSEALPVAHTCFNELDLPDYQDQALFVKKFMKSIQEYGTFDRV